MQQTIHAAPQHHGLLPSPCNRVTRRHSVAGPPPCRALPTLFRTRKPAPLADPSELHTPMDILKHDMEYMEGALSALVGVHEDLVAALNPLAARRMLVDLHAEMKALEAQLEEAQRQLATNEAALQESVSALDSMLEQVKGPGNKAGRQQGLTMPGKESASGAAPGAIGAGIAASEATGLLAPPQETHHRLAPGKAWHAVASARVLRRKGAMVTTEIEGQVYVLFREASGTVACIKDQCAHRGCPLSVGKLVDGHPECPYHGWRYNGEGSCVAMPSTHFQQGIAVDTVPVREADGSLWVWSSHPVSLMEV